VLVWAPLKKGGSGHGASRLGVLVPVEGWCNVQLGYGADIVPSIGGGHCHLLQASRLSLDGKEPASHLSAANKKICPHRGAPPYLRAHNAAGRQRAVHRLKEWLHRQGQGQRRR